MNFGLRIVLEGVCSVVPDSPFFIIDPKTKKPQPGKPKKITVLLADLRSPGLASWSKPEAPVFRIAHWPLLSFDFIDYDAAASTRPIDMILKDPSTGHERGVILLDHEELKVALTAAMQPAQLEPDLTVPDDPYFPRPGSPELTSLWWVAQMERLSTAHGSVSQTNDPSHTGFRFGSDNPLIAALTIEKKGRFYVRDFNRNAYGQIRRWDFGYFNRNGRRVVLSRRPQAVGNQLALELESLDSPAELIFTHKEQGATPSDLKLVLRPPGASRRQTVELRLGNVEPEVLGPGAAVTGTLFGGDPDFEPFYGLSSGHPTTIMPVPLFPTGGSLGIRDKPCASSASLGFR